MRVSFIPCMIYVKLLFNVGSLVLIILLSYSSKFVD